MSKCAACPKFYRKGSIVLVLSNPPRRARVCPECARRGVVVVAPLVAPAPKRQASSTSGVDVAAAIRQLRVYARAAETAAIDAGEEDGHDSAKEAQEMSFHKGRAEAFEGAIALLKPQPTRSPVMSTIRLTPAAQANVDETGCDPQDDIDALRAGTHTEESLLAYCLDGADEDREEGWREYVAAVKSPALVALALVAVLLVGCSSASSMPATTPAESSASSSSTSADTSSASADTSSASRSSGSGVQSGLSGGALSASSTRATSADAGPEDASHAGEPCRAFGCWEECGDGGRCAPSSTCGAGLVCVVSRDASTVGAFPCVYPVTDDAGPSTLPDVAGTCELP